MLRSWRVPVGAMLAAAVWFGGVPALATVEQQKAKDAKTSSDRIYLYVSGIT